MKARIYRPSKSTMQSGLARTGKWVLEYEQATPREPEALMGWSSCADTLSQISMKFDTLKAAQSFAQEKGLEYTVLAERSRKIKPRNYGDNFRYIPPEDKK